MTEKGGADNFGLSVATLTAITYAAGLLTSNNFLADFGVTEFDVVEPHAIFIGALVVGTAALMTVGPMKLLSAALDGRRTALSWSIGRWLICASICIALPLLALVALCAWANTTGNQRPEQFFSYGGWGDEWEEAIRKGAQTAFLLFLCSNLAVASAIQTQRQIRFFSTKKSFSGMGRRLSELVIYFSIAVAALAAFTSLFAESLYGLIPTSIGGGKPAYVQLLIKNDDLPSAKALGLVFDSKSPNVTDPVWVFFDSKDIIGFTFSKSTQVKNNDPHVIGDSWESSQPVIIDRSIVLAIISHN